MSFWSDRCVWITGGTGFLGSHVVRRLNELGCQQFFATGHNDCDLRDADAIRDFLHRPLRLSGSDTSRVTVLHLAAIVGGIGAEREFGFRAKVGFEEGLRRTVEWYRVNVVERLERVAS